MYWPRVQPWRDPGVDRAPGPSLAWLALVLLWAEPASAQVFSPGKLTAAHAPWEAKCEACHEKSKGGAIAPSRCLGCHKVLAVRIRLQHGYHGRNKLRACAKCHAEHLGRAYKAIRWPAGGEKGFDHARAGYELVGKHKGVACRKCHQPAKQQGAVKRLFSAARRQRSYLGLKKACATCHRDVHKGALGVACASCHTEQSFKTVTRFAAHDRTRFPLQGKHRATPCKKCHQPAGKPLRFAGTPSRCQACHKSAHKKTMGQAKASPTACTSCHDAAAWKHIRYARATHPARVPLRGGHGRAPCRKCHGAKANVTPRGTRCASCHRDAHRGRFGKSCSNCHSLYGWWAKKGRIARVGTASRGQKAGAESIGISPQKVQAVAFHNKTRFKLQGRHILVRCAGCHRQKKGRRRFKKLRNLKFGRCTDCHQDPHLGSLSRRKGGEARRCVDCHETRGWSLTSFGIEAHDGTRFPLRHAHQAVACRACHSPKLAAKDRFKRGAPACASCHRDRHRGRYKMTKESPPLACVTCHDERSFARPAFDHAKTRFKLEGAHARAACTACHRPGAGKVTAFRGLDRRCASCHADTRHGGQFSLGETPKDCGACHGTSSFKIARFDHARSAGMPLVGGHSKLACASCHVAVVLPLEDKARPPQVVVRYRLGTAGCEGCHQNPHRGLDRRAFARKAPAVRAAEGKRPAGVAQQAVSRCARCHDESGWRRLKAHVQGFEHERVGYALRGKHATARCASCHQAGRKAQRRCASCHRDPHGGKLGARCAECHQTDSFKPSGLLARHRRTRLPLTGWHALADCSSCHPQNRSRDYRGTPAACVACHADRYRDPNTHPDHAKVGFDQRCERCHRPTGWRPAFFASAAAQLSAHRRLPLSGAHQKIACVRCHQQKKPSPRCVACHERERRRVRSPDHFAPGFSTRCAMCHPSASWRVVTLRGGHRAFALNGRHVKLTCTDCHRDPTRFATVSCTGSCHAPRVSLRKHRRVRGFSLAARACVRCHPSGRR